MMVLHFIGSHLVYSSSSSSSYICVHDSKFAPELLPRRRRRGGGSTAENENQEHPAPNNAHETFRHHLAQIRAESIPSFFFFVSTSAVIPVLHTVSDVVAVQTFVRCRCRRRAGGGTTLTLLYFTSVRSHIVSDVALVVSGIATDRILLYPVLYLSLVSLLLLLLLFTELFISFLAARVYYA